MRRSIGLLVLTSLVIAAWTAAAPGARACEIEPTFAVTIDHLAESDFNAPNSELAADYRDWERDDSASIQVLGVYVYETIHTVEADGDWSRGSVSVPVEIWGQWPADTSPHAIIPEDRSGEPPTTCGWGPSGTSLGTRSYSLVTTVGNVWFDTDGQDPESVLNAAFGAPDVAPRDAAAVDELIARIEANRNSSSGLLVGAGAAALLLAAAVFFFTRRSTGQPDVA